MYRKLREAYKNKQVINLTNLSSMNISSDMYESEPLTLKSTKDNKKYFPVFYTLKNAIRASPSNSVHLLVPGLLPAPDGFWTTGVRNKIYYMPNDSKPHHHGDSPHHLVKWDIDEVYKMSSMSWEKVEGKSIKEYRNHPDIIKFYRGMSDSAVETWINWRIPHNEKEYPELIVKKNSIVWWDFFNTHNLGLVLNKIDYVNNNFNNIIRVSKNNNKESQTLVTIMDKIGTYYFVCSVSGHAQMGHKIKIMVI